jgi:cysteine synthase B
MIGMQCSRGLSATERRTERTGRSAALRWLAEAGFSDVPSVVRLIGDTPLARLTRLSEGLPPSVQVCGKVEGLNPGGSIKDRAGAFIVYDGLKSGRLGPSKTLIDATSGNTGIAYAMMGAALRFKVRLAMPADVTPERVRILRAYGAEVILTDAKEATHGARRLVRQIVADHPDRYFDADQYDNPANVLAHYSTTGPEIWQQTAGWITHFVACMGTSGTMMGVGSCLKEQNPAIELIGVQPDGPTGGIDGLKHLATEERPGIYDGSLVDREIGISGERAWGAARRLAQEDGLFVGISAGAAAATAVQVARELEEGLVVALLPDGGFKYVSAPFWAE